MKIKSGFFQTVDRKFQPENLIIITYQVNTQTGAVEDLIRQDIVIPTDKVSLYISCIKE